MNTFDSGGPEEADKHIREVVKRLARLYDHLVASKHHEAEVYLASLVGGKTDMRGPRDLAFYMTRSLQRRGWPAYAEAAAFKIQTRLFLSSDGARIDALFYEWRALRLKWREWSQEGKRCDWMRVVEEALQRRQAGGPSKKAELVVKQDAIAKRLRQAGPAAAADLSYDAEMLAYLKTLIDAEEVAEQLLAGPRSDLELFLGDPLALLKKKEAP